MDNDHGDEHSDRPAPRVLSEGELRALVSTFPQGVLEAVAEVLTAGGKAKGCAANETGGGQSLEDHLFHAREHVYGAQNEDTSEPHVLHAIARLVLAAGCE